MGNSSSSSQLKTNQMISSGGIFELTPKQQKSLSSNIYLNNLIKLDKNNNLIPSPNSVNCKVSKKKNLKSPLKKIKKFKNKKSSSSQIQNNNNNNNNSLSRSNSIQSISSLSSSSSSISLPISTPSTTIKNVNNNNNNNNNNEKKSFNKILPEYLIIKIIGFACDIVFPSNSFFQISMVCRLWNKLSIKSIRHLYYSYKFLYERDSDLNYCRIIGRWLTPRNHYQSINRCQAIYLRFGLDPLGFCYLVPYLMKCSTLRLLRIEFSNSLLSPERVNTIIQILTVNQHIRVLNLSCNAINSKISIDSLCDFFESKNSDGLKEYIHRKSKLNSYKLSKLLESIVKSNKITIINFSNNEIENDDMDIIIYYISTSKYLHTINFAKNFLNTSSLHLIINACINNRVTKSLDLRCNNFDSITDRDSFLFQYSSKFTNFLI
ncbi:hypothetical protein DDB_G0281371 [Dictyostelium discoideum AX4]|uniref:F-box domain-containing protein n=1 Tax=Dictyostelium discoideum TaxID=44689 RepID=Q54U32_DICDI|nr:hypothetical protein DDB_G0281371 [Dictyostelium discoideum AX4]EAL66771.1 hypothetical protein DDB_G0281371 [Dictyostelium discoideum AX4]|eukprot:XP_640733.1 hypothetical protein DDB_G0281371 [Dictyostelium discoideum AX4]